MESQRGVPANFDQLVSSARQPHHQQHVLLQKRGGKPIELRHTDWKERKVKTPSSSKIVSGVRVCMDRLCDVGI